MAKLRKQNQTAHPLQFLLVSGSDGSTPVYGATPAVGLSKDGGNFAAPAGAVSEVALATPSGLTVTPTGAPGSTSYGYRVSAVNVNGETLACAEVTTATGNATLSGSNYNALSWSAVTGASGYNVYGRTAGAELKLAAATSTTYNDTGAATPSGALPAQNTTSAGWYQVAGNAADCDTLGPLVLHATAAGAQPTDSEFQVVAYDPDSPTVQADLTAAALQKAAREALGVAGTLWHVSLGGSNADGLTWATAKTSPSGLTTAAGDALLLAAGQTFAVASAGVALADGVSVLGNGAAIAGAAPGPDALLMWGGANAALRDLTIDASAVFGLNPLSGGPTSAAPTNASLDRVRLRGVIDGLVFGGGDLTVTDCDFRADYAVDPAGHTLGQGGFAGDGGYADATNLSGGAVRFVGGRLRADGRGFESSRALNVTGGATVWTEETILEALNPPAGGNAYAIFAAGAGTTVHVTGKRVNGNPYDVYCNNGATVILTDVAGGGADGAITVDPAGTGAVITRGKSRTAAAAVASAVWGAASRTITGATSPLPTTVAGAGPYALTHNGGAGAAGAPITVAGSPAGADRLRVVDPDGNGIAGAVLRLYLATDTTLSNPLAAATTGPDGRWVGPIYCQSGSYQLVIAYPGRESDSEVVGVP